jgi:hypothetical protein
MPLSAIIPFPDKTLLLSDFFKQSFMYFYEYGAEKAGIDINDYIDIVDKKIKHGPPAKQQRDRYNELRKRYKHKKAVRKLCKQYYETYKQ